MTTIWRPDNILASPSQSLPVFNDSEMAPLSDGRWFWDFAPVVVPTGEVYRQGDTEYWLALTAPESADPELRHFIARLAVLQLRAGKWSYVGELQLRETHPGNREWAGMAVVNGSSLEVYFTSAGIREKPEAGYQQRLWTAKTSLAALDEPAVTSSWHSVSELVEARHGPYLPADQTDGEPGRIHAFRDPFLVRDCGNFSDYIVFTATSAQVDSSWNGCIGLAALDPSTMSWRHRGPLIISDGVTTEFERAHLVFAKGLYYLFWSTPDYTFSPNVAAPTGLYGAVSEQIDSGYRLLNGSGLVVANPAERPSQCYSWYVTKELAVQGFVDLPDRKQAPGPAADETDAHRYAGTAAPQFFLQLDGDQTSISHEKYSD